MSQAADILKIVNKLYDNHDVPKDACIDLLLDLYSALEWDLQPYGQPPLSEDELREVAHELLFG